MLTDDLSVAEIADQLDDSYFKLIFLESAIRGLIQTGNINESYVGEGLAIVLRSLISENKGLQKLILERIRGLETVISDESLDLAAVNERKKET